MYQAYLFPLKELNIFHLCSDVQGDITAQLTVSNHNLEKKVFKKLGLIDSKEILLENKRLWIYYS